MRRQPHVAFKIFPSEIAPSRSTLLFVHGMAHGAWCWEWLWVPWLQKKGYPCVTMNLRGHSESEGWEHLRFTSIADYVRDVKYVISQLKEPPVIVGHSMGGFIVQKLLLAGTQLRAAILIASVPATGFGKGLWRLLRLAPLRFLRALLTLSTTPFSESPEIVRKLCFSPDVPRERVHSAFMCMQPESFRAFLDMLFLDLHKPRRVSVPILCMAAGRDLIVENKALEKTARAFGSDYVLLPELAHNMMLDTHWEKACEKLHAWLQAKGL
ncbi:MAG: lysophospholipase [Flavobacteriales bacterium]|nr:lysophospholipase [Flavobacteriales bacterium]MCX7768770.1 lysophospholipase [Flavobacteriales bacterium]MDW8409436.1 alpha/beta hydrolase [Flavobacteriales bacterium]